MLMLNLRQENGAAFEAGGLEVGQLILEVDGTKVEGLHHQVICNLERSISRVLKSL